MEFDGFTEPLTIARPEIEHARQLLGAHVRTTPVVATLGSDFGLECSSVVFKLEQLQCSGSFKVRGAFVNLLSRAMTGDGVVAASGGNHGAAVAYAAMRTGVNATIFVPAVASPAKVRRIRAYGADVEIAGERYADALAASEAWAAKTSAMPVHAFDQRETVLGQATIGLELEAQAPNLDTVLVPVGGGGLIAGVAAWYAGKARIVGVEPTLAPTLTAALSAGMPVDAPAGGLAADSLAPRRVGERIFPILRALVDRVVLVSDEEIRSAQHALWSCLRVVAEPAGAAALAALLSRRYEAASTERVGVIVSGANSSEEHQ